MSRLFPFDQAQHKSDHEEHDAKRQPEMQPADRYNIRNASDIRNGSENGSSFWAMESIVDDELKEGESGTLTYNFYFRGISVGKKEFSLTKGSAYPSYEELIPKGYYVTSPNPLPSGTMHLKGEWVEIPVERVAIDTEVDATEADIPASQPLYYDLQGRRHTYPTKGLYITNGKKVVIK